MSEVKIIGLCGFFGLQKLIVCLRLLIYSGIIRFLLGVFYVYYVIIFLSIVSIMQADAMAPGAALPMAPNVPADMLVVKNLHRPPGKNQVVYPTCTGMAYEQPTIKELKDSHIGRAIEKGDIAPVRGMFDGPSGWRYLIYRLFIDQENLWVRAVHGLLIAVGKPHETTGPIAAYLWKKIEKGYPNGQEAEERPYSELASKGACLILNAYQNGHHQILDKMLQRPFMKYGICESIRQAVQVDNIHMLRYLFAQGVQCNEDVLFEAIKIGREVPAFWLIKNKVGMNWCDQYDGSPLHVAIQYQSVLVSRLIVDMPENKINCHTNYVVFSEAQGWHRRKETALNLLFNQVPLDERNIELLMRRGGNVGPGSSDKHRKLLVRYRKKFALALDQACFHDAAGKEVDCLPLKQIGW